jgi:hypothetical protein
MFKLIPKKTFTGIIIPQINNKNFLQTNTVSFLSNKYKYMYKHNNISTVLEINDSIDTNRNFPIDSTKSILLIEYVFNKNKYIINETIEMSDDSYNGNINCMYSLIINNNIQNSIFIDDYTTSIDLLGKSIKFYDIINNKFNKEFN